MNTVEIIDEKIKTLKDRGGLNNEKLNEINSELVLIKECLDAIEDENKIINYNFSNAILLIEKYNYPIENLGKIINDIKSAIEIKKDYPEIEISDNQKLVLENFKEVLLNLQIQLEQSVEELSQQDNHEELTKNLGELKDILEGKGRVKKYTPELFESFYEVIDWDNLTREEALELYRGIYNTRNFKGKASKDPADFEEVIELYDEFLGITDTTNNNKKKREFAKLLNDKKKEICAYIDLDNTREILQFFKDENILESFHNPALLEVSIFAKSDYVKKLYNEIINERPGELDIYFEEAAATLWVVDNNSSSNKRSPFRIKREKITGENNSQSLYAQCHKVSDKERKENIALLEANKELFSDKYDTSVLGAHLLAKTSSLDDLGVFKNIVMDNNSSTLRKNLNLFKLFGIGELHKIAVSCFESGDLEDKLHLAIELGLLNPPQSETYLEMEKGIIGNDNFKKQHKIGSIRNYFQRYVTTLSTMPINKYAMLSCKLGKIGQFAFYNSFFSDVKSGQMSSAHLDEQEKTILDSSELLEDYLKENSFNYFYTTEAFNFDEYDKVITKYDEMRQKSNNNQYYDPEILEDELIQKLENENCVYDSITRDGEQINYKNQFVYVFGNLIEPGQGRIISRLKVLHNASILKQHYGVLDEDMLFASIIRNSYLNKQEFDLIEESILEMGEKNGLSKRI